MTSDAKIGLLLGLVFIFIIAFVINGLPSLRNDTNNNELTTNMVNSQNRPGISARTREVVDQNARFEIVLPKSPPAIENQQIREVADNLAIPSLPQPIPTTAEEQISQPAQKAFTLPKVYVVCDGESLATIAKKVYGPEDGNRKVNVTRIYVANNKILKSKNEIYPGQKLTIPSLSSSSQSKNNTILSNSMLEKVKSIGKRQVSPVSNKPGKSSWYIVKEGDSLWRIAAEQIGDGSRYNEIVRLNANIIDDEDNLIVGMRLKMPVR